MLLRRAEAHDVLDAGPVVPAAVEDHDLAAGREALDVALDVHLGLLAIGRRRQRDDAEHTRAHPLGERLDGAALAGRVAPLEDDDDALARDLDPVLQPAELDLQLAQFLLVDLALELVRIVTILRHARRRWRRGETLLPNTRPALDIGQPLRPRT